MNVARFLRTSLLMILGACAEIPEPPPEPARVPVRSEVVAPGPFQPSLTLFGRVEPAARVEVRTAETGVLRYPPRFAGGLRTGERVEGGEPLFAIDNEALRLRLAEAELALRSAESELDRAQRGVDGGFLPDAELKRRQIEAELARARLASARLQLERLDYSAPRSGVLWVERSTPGGTEVAAGTLLAEIAGDGRRRVEAWATAADLERLEPGLAADCRLPGSGVVVGRGTLAELARRVDRDGTLRLVVEIAEDRDLPPPGEGVELDVHLAARAEALTLPEEAVLVDGGITTVFVLEASGAQYKASLRPVRAGSRSHGRIEIVDGLRDGERVAVEGTEFLADGLLAVEAEGEG